MNIVLDLSPGLFDNELLGEQMRKVAALLDNKAAFETVDVSAVSPNWRGCEDALAIRVNELIAEMRLRDIPAPDWVEVPVDAIIWPAQKDAPLMRQFEYLQERSTQGKAGRIRLPKSAHELWASYKYSTLARNHRAYLQMGQMVSSRIISFEDLLERLESICKVRPSQGGLTNALQHMWGYVSQHSSLDPNKADLKSLLEEVQRLAMDNQDTYLLNSTALGELVIWTNSLQ